METRILTTTSDQESIDRVDAQHGPCGVCGGKFSEHQNPNVKHVFSAEGQLISKEQAAKQQQRPVRFPQTGEAGLVGRLVEVLMAQHMVSQEEALYVAGMGPKPNYEHQQYRDPVGG